MTQISPFSFQATKSVQLWFFLGPECPFTYSSTTLMYPSPVHPLPPPEAAFNAHHRISQPNPCLETPRPKSCAFYQQTGSCAKETDKML